MRYFISILLFLSFTGLLLSQKRISYNPPHFDSFNFNDHIIRGNNVTTLDSVIRYDFWVTMSDGTLIDALKYIPFNVTPPSGGFPTVIAVHGYADNKETNAKYCHDQAQYGYYTATYSVRGQGNSGGQSNLISLTEAQDLIEFVNYVKNDSIHGSNPNNILIMGGSQGGLLPYMAACNGLNVKTIISSLSPPNFASSWIENGSIKMTFLWSVTYDTTYVRYNPLVTAMANWVFADNKNKWDSLAHWVPINRDFMSSVSNNHIPLIVEGTWQDKFFNGSGIIQGTNYLTNVPLFRMYLGAVDGHGGDKSTAENQWHNKFFGDWYDYWLLGTPNGENSAPKYEYASTSLPMIGKNYTFVHDSSNVWPPPYVSNWRLYFNTDSSLTSFPSPSLSAFAQLNNNVTGGLTMQDAVDAQFRGSFFNSKFTKSKIYFQTSALRHDTKLIGTPVINIDYSSTCSTFCQYNFQIYEVDPNDSLYFINRVNYTDRNYPANARRMVSFSGQAHSHIFHTGNKIRVVVTNLDTGPHDGSLLGTNPFVLPVLINGVNTIYLNNNSYIDLPITTNFSSSADLLDNPNAEKEFTLKQNYPNPFNPVTKIEYSIPFTSKVIIKVYDVLGKEVKTLADEVQDEGIHTVAFDAANLASGIYFYKLTAGSLTDVKKMVVVK